MPLMLPGATMYGGVNAQAMHMYHQGVNPGRRKEHGGVALRSPLLDEFRANKARKWELRVSSLGLHMMRLPALILGRRP